MIQRKDLLALGYYQSAAFTGSDGPMRYRIVLQKAEAAAGKDGETPDAKSEDKEGGPEAEPAEDCFAATVWPGPYAWDATDPARMQTITEPYTEEGLCRIAERLNALRKTFAEADSILDREPWTPETDGRMEQTEGQ